MMTRRDALVMSSIYGMICYAGKSFGAVNQKIETYILPPDLNVVKVKPYTRELIMNIDLQLVNNYYRTQKIFLAGLEIKINNAISEIPYHKKNISVSPSVILTDKNGLAKWNATIPLRGLPDKSDEKIMIRPRFFGYGNLLPSPDLNTVIINIRYRNKVL
jgi:hypothetical protein